MIKEANNRRLNQLCRKIWRETIVIRKVVKPIMLILTKDKRAQQLVIKKQTEAVIIATAKICQGLSQPTVYPMTLINNLHHAIRKKIANVSKSNLSQHIHHQKLSHSQRLITLQPNHKFAQMPSRTVDSLQLPHAKDPHPMWSTIRKHANTKLWPIIYWLMLSTKLRNSKKVAVATLQETGLR